MIDNLGHNCKNKILIFKKEHKRSHVHIRCLVGFQTSIECLRIDQINSAKIVGRKRTSEASQEKEKHTPTAMAVT